MQLRALIADNDELALLALGDEDTPADDVAAAALATTLMPRQVVRGRQFTELGVIAAFTDPAEGDAALRSLAQAAQADDAGGRLLTRMLRWLEPGAPGLDFGNPALRAAITAYAVANVLTPLQCDTLLALGEQAVTVDPSDIARSR